MNQSFGSPVLDTAVRLLTPSILLFALYVIGHGHYSPGGGFQGGVISAAALIVVRLVRGRRESWGLDTAESLALAAAGLVLYAGIGFLALLFGGNFLDYGALPLGIDPPYVRVVGSFGIEVGVGLAVMGVMILIFETLVGEEKA